MSWVKPILLYRFWYKHKNCNYKFRDRKHLHLCVMVITSGPMHILNSKTTKKIHIIFSINISDISVCYCEA